MKMFKLMGKRGFAVFTSLALCASLVAPSLAASFTDLNNAINGTYEGTAITVEGGKITLKEDVVNTGNENSITVGEDRNVIIDLAGWTIDHSAKNGGSTIWVNGGSLTLEDSSEGKTGTVTGGDRAGIYVGPNSSLEMNGGTISGNTTDSNGGGVVVDGAGASFVMKGGEISGNDITGTSGNGYGGGVYVTAGGSFTMEGGEISGNTAKSSGGGVAVNGAGSNFVMTGGEVSGNTAANTNGTAGGGGGGVWVKGGATFEMSGDSMITDNQISGSNGGGGGVGVHQGNFVMNGGEISGNTAGKGDGVQVHGTTGTGPNKGPASFIMNEGTIKGGVTVMDEGGNAGVAINGGNVSSLDSKYLEGKGLVENGDGTYSVQKLGEDGHIWSEWVETPAQIGVAGSRDRHCVVTGCGQAQRETIDPLPVPTPTPDPEVEIDEPAVPLAAGPVTQGEFVDYLWRHEGEPEAEPIMADDHEYAPAISWAQSAGIIDAETFDADDLVTVAMVRDILTRFALYADMAMPELTTLADDDDEAVLNCDEILAEFFGE